MITHIFTGLFIVAMICNAIAFVRFWRMMRVFHVMIDNFAETQRQFNEIMEQEQASRRVDKLLHPADPIKPGTS